MPVSNPTKFQISVKGTAGVAEQIATAALVVRWIGAAVISFLELEQRFLNHFDMSRNAIAALKNAIEPHKIFYVVAESSPEATAQWRAS